MSQQKQDWCSTLQMEIGRLTPLLDLTRGGSNQTTEGAREVRGVGETGGVSRLGNGLAARELTGASHDAAALLSELLWHR